MNFAESHGPSKIAQFASVVLIAAIAVTGAAMWSLHLGSAGKTNGLTTTTTSLSGLPASYPSKDLPPSHDNDAGKARALDSTPDNDTDAWQRG